MFYSRQAGTCRLRSLVLIRPSMLRPDFEVISPSFPRKSFDCIPTNDLLPFHFSTPIFSPHPFFLPLPKPNGPWVIRAPLSRNKIRKRTLDTYFFFLNFNKGHHTGENRGTMRQTLRRSCAACAKSKHSCDLRTPRCSRCTKRKVLCVYANEPLTAAPPPPPAAPARDINESVAAQLGSLTNYRFGSLDPFESYPPTRLPREHVQRLIHSCR